MPLSSAGFGYLAILVSRSTTTQMVLFPSTERGKPTMKSMDIPCHFSVAISRGCNMPTFFCRSALMT